ncbi:MAG: aldo/keto reductase [Phycisphaerales bacterium]|nr:aldo/keto reductase [Phycisphaerales bacterium]
MLHWGILATGRIASVFAKGLAASKTGKLVAVASRTQEKADRFGLDDQHWGDFLKDQPIKRYGSYEALLADKSIDAVYIATPHPQHLEWACKAAEAGKNVLVEKPIGLNHAQAMIALEHARKNNVFLMEAFMYRCSPMFAKVIELIQHNAIGQVRALQANFSFNCGPNYESRALKNSLGGGGILDVGCYPTTFARLLAGVAFNTNTPIEPTDFKATGHVGPTGADEYSFAVAKFTNPNDPKHAIIATLGTGVQVNMDNIVRIYGSSGSITFGNWVPKTQGNTVTLFQNGKPPQEFNCDSPAGATAYTNEADTFAAAVAAGKKQADFPAMSWTDTLNNMKLLDNWRSQIGQIYDAEKPENLNAPMHGKPLAVSKDSPMTYASFPGLTKKVSRVFLGTMVTVIDKFPYTCALLDDFYERGGNAFDTAHIYAGGKGEKGFGQWLKSRNIREKIVILGKGAHPPHTNPKAITTQLKESLDRLQTDYLDIYMMHRDNTEIPIGEFVDVLHDHVAAGRIKTLGASNWSLDRVDAFNAYAAKHHKTPITSLSDNLSLAHMNDPIWSGCICANEPQRLAWHAKTQIALLSWSSQARGFFAVGDPAYTADKDLVRCWYSPENFARLKRAKELAKKKSTTAIAVNLAWVLTQAFPTFALIGPQTLEETRTSLAGLSLTLTPDEVQWLLNG